MKKIYNNPEINVVYINSADCITSSKEGIGYGLNDTIVRIDTEGKFIIG